MATFEVNDPKKIRELQKLLKAGGRQSVIVNDDVSPAVPRGTYVVRNKVDLDIVASYFDFDVPSGHRGRPPVDQLRKVVERSGSKLDSKQYKPSDKDPKRYLVTALVRSGNRISPKQAEITAGEVRAFANQKAATRGRLSQSLIIEAVKTLYEWTGNVIDGSVTVVALD